MKKFLALALMLTVFPSYGKEEVKLSFDTIVACKKQSKELVDSFNTMTLRQFYTSFGLQADFDELPGIKMLVKGLNEVKSEAGELKYTEEIGTASLGTFYTKVGYIIKYESGTFFCEVTIGKISESEFKILGMALHGQKSGQQVIEKIPEYYWK